MKIEVKFTDEEVKRLLREYYKSEATLKVLAKQTIRDITSVRAKEILGTYPCDSTESLPKDSP